MIETEAKVAVETKDCKIIRAMCHKLLGSAKSVRTQYVAESVEHLRQLAIAQKQEDFPNALATICVNLQNVAKYAKQNNIIS